MIFSDAKQIRKQASATQKKKQKIPKLLPPSYILWGQVESLEANPLNISEKEGRKKTHFIPPLIEPSLKRQI